MYGDNLAGLVGNAVYYLPDGKVNRITGQHSEPRLTFGGASNSGLVDRGYDGVGHPGSGQAVGLDCNAIHRSWNWPANQSISIMQPLSPIGEAGMTVSWWRKHIEPGTGYGSSYRYQWTIGESGGYNDSNGCNYEQNGWSQQLVNWGNSGNSVNDSSTDIRDDVHHSHYAVRVRGVVSGNVTVEIWKNGRLLGTDTQQWFGVRFRNLWLMNRASGNRQGTGILKQFVAWPFPIGEDHIRKLYQAGHGVDLLREPTPVRIFEAPEPVVNVSPDSKRPAYPSHLAAAELTTYRTIGTEPTFSHAGGEVSLLKSSDISGSNSRNLHFVNARDGASHAGWLSNQGGSNQIYETGGYISRPLNWQPDSVLSGFMFCTRTSRNGLGPSIAITNGSTNRYLRLTVDANTSRSVSVTVNHWNGSRSGASIAYNANEADLPMPMFVAFSARRQPTGTTADYTFWQISRGYGGKLRYKSTSAAASSWDNTLHQPSLVLNPETVSTNLLPKMAIASGGFFDCELTDADVLELFKLGPTLRRNVPRFPLTSPPPTGEISGSSSVGFGSSATLSDGAGGNLAGTSSVAFSANGTLSAAIGIAGSSSVSFDSSAAIVGVGALGGTSSVSFDSSAILAAAGYVVGTSSASFSAIGTLDVPGAVRGVSPVGFSSSGTLSATAALVASSSTAFDANAALSAAYLLAGSSSVAFSSDATLGATVDISGTSSVAFSAIARLVNGSDFVNVPGVEFRFDVAPPHYRYNGEKLHFRVERPK